MQPLLRNADDAAANTPSILLYYLDLINSRHDFCCLCQIIRSQVVENRTVCLTECNGLMIAGLYINVG